MSPSTSCFSDFCFLPISHVSCSSSCTPINLFSTPRCSQRSVSLQDRTNSSRWTNSSSSHCSSTNQTGAVFRLIPPHPTGVAALLIPPAGVRSFSIGWASCIAVRSQDMSSTSESPAVAVWECWPTAATYRILLSHIGCLRHNPTESREVTE